MLVSIFATGNFCYAVAMTKLEQIQSSIETLSDGEIAKLRNWFAELDARIFDEKIERDAKSGKLSKLSERALADHRTRFSRKL